MTQPIRVIIVDDEPRARRGLALLLGKLDGFEIVAEAGGGEAAVQQIRELRPELVFLDIQMPEIDGFEPYVFTSEAARRQVLKWWEEQAKRSPRTAGRTGARREAHPAGHA